MCVSSKIKNRLGKKQYNIQYYMIIAVTTVSPPVSDGQITIQSHTPVLGQHSLTYLPSPQRHSFCGGFMKCQPQPSHSPLALKSSIPYPFFQDQSSCTLLASQFWVWYLLPGSTSGYPSLASCIGVIYTMIVWGCYPIPLFCQQSSTTPDHTKTW